jgi:hypothetical protein
MKVLRSFETSRTVRSTHSVTLHRSEDVKSRSILSVHNSVTPFLCLISVAWPSTWHCPSWGCVTCWALICGECRRDGSCRLPGLGCSISKVLKVIIIQWEVMTALNEAHLLHRSVTTVEHNPRARDAFVLFLHKLTIPSRYKSDRCTHNFSRTVISAFSLLWNMYIYTCICTRTHIHARTHART